LPVNLNKGSRELFGFPRRARFAGLQTHRDVLDPHRLAGTQGQVADDAIALVQQTQHRNPLRHRRHAGNISGGAGNVDRNRLIPFPFELAGAIAARKQENRNGKEDQRPRHAYSGFHAS
jgi:hypothetical protein